jgi:hypothetical protein
MKRIAVKVAGSGTEPQDLNIKPGTTAGEILAQLGLQGYLLALANADHFFGADEVVYTQVPDGAKLLATSTAEVGRG